MSQLTFARHPQGRGCWLVLGKAECGRWFVEAGGARRRTFNHLTARPTPPPGGVGAQIRSPTQPIPTPPRMSGWHLRPPVRPVISVGPTLTAAAGFKGVAMLREGGFGGGAAAMGHLAALERVGVPRGRVVEGFGAVSYNPPLCGRQFFVTCYGSVLIVIRHYLWPPRDFLTVHWRASSACYGR